MKLESFINKLEKIKSKHGNIDVIMADFLKIKKIKVVKDLKYKNVLVVTDLK